MSNLVLLCRQCHDAAHEQATAPTVDFRSTGDMSTDSFGAFLKFFRELPTARFNSNEEVWRIPTSRRKSFGKLVKLQSRRPSPTEVNDEPADAR